MDTVLQRRNQRPRRPGLLRILFRLTLFTGVAGLFSAILIILYALALEAPPVQIEQSTLYYGADGSVIGEHQNGNKRYWVELEDMAPEVEQAVLAIEDREFYKHNGFDFPRIASAIAANLQSMSKAQGASTISQQYARNLFLSHDKTWSRKLEEAFYALRLEAHYEKEDILEGYLNTIYYGHGAYGIEAASRLYFDKSAGRLSLAEAALLAGVPKGPSYYSPFSYPDRALDRQKIVLASMETTGAISSEERRVAEQETLSFAAPGRLADERIGPYFQDHVESLLAEEYDIEPGVVDRGGLHIYTTLDPKLQRIAEKRVKLEIPNGSELQGALVSLDPNTGDVRALAGGKSYEESAYNRVTDAARPPGSAFKPFLYYAALEKGFTPLTSFKSEETEFEVGENGETYAPGNYGQRYADDFITMAEALAVSDNIFAVKTHLFLGPDALVDAAKKAGIQGKLSPLPSLALGTQNVNMLNLAAAYSPFANGGNAVTPRFIQKVTDSEGNVLVETKPEKMQVFDEQKAYVMADMMRGMFDVNMDSYTSVTGASIAHLINRPLAGKSGTTDFDSWMVGFAPQLSTAVWVGYDDNREMNHAEEGQISKRIWSQFMSEGLQDELKMAVPPPDDIVKLDIDPETGLLGSEECGPSRAIAFEKGTEPVKSCTDELEEEARQAQEESEEDLPEQKEKFFDRLRKWFE
ncbi:transglycosylase domain-containing protein [Alteribacillus sp. HJP-4]|uniref:transglycosylase domain-containing protein n=1 Tax=Alteribacillus sp. HJP-4 TaxID=2775394 RepID=UPI0035CD1C14